MSLLDWRKFISWSEGNATSDLFIYLFTLVSYGLCTLMADWLCFLRVTLGDGSQWLIHKGGNYGISSQTVVTSARHMSSDWTVNLHFRLSACRFLTEHLAVTQTVFTGGSNRRLRRKEDGVRLRGSRWHRLQPPVRQLSPGISSHDESVNMNS